MTVLLTDLVAVIPSSTVGTCAFKHGCDFSRDAVGFVTCLLYTKNTWNTHGIEEISRMFDYYQIVDNPVLKYN